MLTLIAGKTILILALTAHSTNICPCCSPCTAWSGPARCDHRGGEWRCCRRRRRSPHICTASPSRGSRTCLSSRTRRRGSRAAGQRPSPGQTQSVLFGAEVHSGKVRGSVCLQLTGFVTTQVRLLRLSVNIRVYFFWNCFIFSFQLSGRLCPDGSGEGSLAGC